MATSQTTGRARLAARHTIMVPACPPRRAAALTGGCPRTLPPVIAIDVSGAGPPLVLVHGVGTNRGVWRRVTPLLTAGRLVVAPDLPGFGHSPPVGRGFALAPVADALAQALAAALAKPFDLLG